MSDEFWDSLTVTTFVLKPVLTAAQYCDLMKGGTLALLYSLVLQLDEMYSEPINVKPGLVLDETRDIRRKVYEVFMPRWSAFHAPIHSAAFAMDRQLCQIQMVDEEGHLVCHGGFFEGSCCGNLLPTSLYAS